MTKKKHAGGRPSDYTVELTERICERIASGEALTKICEDPGMPSTVTVFSWLDKHPEFLSRYARAREAQGDLMDRLIMEAACAEPERITVTIGDDARKEGVDTGEVQHRRLKIDALKWRAAHLRPKVYGVQRSEVEHTGKLTLEQILEQANKPTPQDTDHG